MTPPGSDPSPFNGPTLPGQSAPLGNSVPSLDPSASAPPPPPPPALRNVPRQRNGFRWIQILYYGFFLFMFVCSLLMWGGEWLENKGIKHYNAGLAARKQGDTKTAIAEYTKSIDSAMHDMDKSDAYVERGLLYYNTDQYDKALADFSSSLAIDDGQEPAYFDRGLVYIEQKDYSKALKDFDSAAQIKPDNPRVYNQRALIYALQKQPDLALAQATLCRAHGGTLSSWAKESLTDAFADRARQEAIAGKYPAALSDENQILAINPNHAPTYRNRAIIYGLLKDMGHAQTDVQKFKSLGGKPDQIAQLEASLQKLQNSYQKAG